MAIFRWRTELFVVIALASSVREQKYEVTAEADPSTDDVDERQEQIKLKVRLQASNATDSGCRLEVEAN